MKLYIIDKEDFHIIAKYATNGEVTALCERNSTSSELLGFTTTGKLFKINFDLTEQPLKEF